MYTVRCLMRNEVNPDDPGSLYRKWHYPRIGRHIFSARSSSSWKARHSSLDPPPCSCLGDYLTEITRLRINSYILLRNLSRLRRRSSHKQDILDGVMRTLYRHLPKDEDDGSPW